MKAKKYNIFTYKDQENTTADCQRDFNKFLERKQLEEWKLTSQCGGRYNEMSEWGVQEENQFGQGT